MKILALGTTEFLISCVNGLVAAGCSIQGLISLPGSILPDNSIDVRSHASRIGCEYFETENINSDGAKDYLRAMSPDLLFSAWPKLISPDVLRIPKYGVIGTHPTALPFNKGRHPLQWQIVLGIRESSLTFFWMDTGIDSGPIILQAPYQVLEQDTIATLTKCLNAVAYSASRLIGESLASGNIPKGDFHDPAQGNVWRRRDRHDVLIDFRMGADEILALVRSFTEPYPCATVLFEKHLLHVISGEKIVPILNTPMAFLEPGSIVKVEDYFVSVKCANCVLRLHVKENASAILGSSKYIYPPTRYLARSPELSSIFS